MDSEALNWTTTQTVHEGFPLFLRYPQNIRDESAVFPILGVVTHHLAKVRANGLPDPDYNDGLLEFDRTLQNSFQDRSVGRTVLIETFAGKRNYYAYVASENLVRERVAVLQRQFPTEKLSWKAYPDEKWSFIKDYTKAVLEPASQS
jgi:hypothetical protein